MNRKEFNELTNEIIPIVDSLTEVFKKHIQEDKNCSVIVKGNGHFHFMIEGIKYTASREKNSSGVVYIP